MTGTAIVKSGSRIGRTRPDGIWVATNPVFEEQLNMLAGGNLVKGYTPDIAYDMAQLALKKIPSCELVEYIGSDEEEYDHGKIY
ncbi:hypothetical protein [uncultured Methanolobus sp.]|uniref:hypothetical protein n=1 Tax=uncultured Methanolobus sp. TaxID=218300 RepID=UPI0029C840BA|nr:hypothetical protein [uncultured Methanolobus sp.]